MLESYKIPCKEGNETKIHFSDYEDGGICVHVDNVRQGVGIELVVCLSNSDVDTILKMISHISEAGK